MAISKLQPFSFLSPQPPICIQKLPPSHISLLPFKTPFHLQLKTHSPTPSLHEQHKTSLLYQPNCESISDSLSVAFPALAYSNIMFFNSAYNVQVIVGVGEPEEKLIGRFRRDVLRAGVIQESKRRRFHETNQEKRKRKTREAARRYRKRKPQAKVLKQVKEEAPKKEELDDDNWEEYLDIDVPYCSTGTTTTS